MALSKSKEKERENLREEFRQMVEEEEKLVMKLEKEQSADLIRRRKDFVRRLELERREAALNGVVLKAQEVATLQKNQLEQEEKLAVELDLIRRQEIADEKLRLHLRENSPELRELEAQLKAAYVKKAIAAQLAEKEANKLEEELMEKKAKEIIEKAVGTLEEQENADRLNEKRQKEEFRHSLQDQIIEKERLKQVEFMSCMKEKKMFDDIVQKIKEEEQKEMEEKKIVQQKLREEMEEFYTARAMWKAKERLVIQEEQEKMRQINEKREREKEEARVEASVKNWARQEASNKMQKEFNEKQKQREEKEAIVSSLMQNEIKEKENEKAQADFVRETARRQEVRDAYKRNLEEKSRKKKEEKELDVQFARQMKLRIDAEDKREQERQGRRRQDEIDNLNYNKEAVRKNVQKRAEELKMTQMVNELEEMDERRRARLVEEERIKLLREHAPKLMGYFPKGCLRKEDYEALGLAENSPLPEDREEDLPPC